MRTLFQLAAALVLGGPLLFATGVSADPAPASVVDDTALRLPEPGDNTLHVLSPTVLELRLTNTKAPDPATVAQWNLVNSTGQFVAPALSEFVVTVSGQPVTVQGVGFKRRPLYAPLGTYDLRIDNGLDLQLASPVADNQVVQVTNPDGSLWPTNRVFATLTDPLRYSPAIHVNQEGYVPEFPKKAMVGYYLGSLGELPIPASAGFALVDATTGAPVYQGSLTLRPDTGYNYSPTPYQQVYEADFGAFTTPGVYRLQVPGLGASLPFRIDEGVAMAFARAYALGLYHQRCGTNNAMPYTRFVHAPCHTAAASVPVPESDFQFTWNTISNYATLINSENPPQIAPLLTNESAQLYPYVNTGTIDVSGGHHDAGDYSKYTANSTKLIHTLIFAVDAFPGVAALDNLGIPESGDGISDLLEEAKWEADFLAKMQDADGGFYFLVYPVDREYESNVLPDQGDPQVVWPKTTSVTAAGVAALAQCASSPLFKQTFPVAASNYLAKAQLGWTFLTNAIARYGKAGAYQKITHYGDDFTHDDELAWAACEMFLATGNQAYYQQLTNWFNPSDPNTWRWGWWHMSECYGNAIRSYAFAARTGRLSTNQLDPTFLSACENQIAAAANDALTWAQDCAYGTSFPTETKAVLGAGWYFSSDQAFDLAVGYQLNASPQYLDAILLNMNYEGGCNPVNVTYVTGLGQKRQREIVSQYAQNDRRVLPPSGIPLGNIQTGFATTLYYYGPELGELCYPQDGSTNAPYPFYDRWGDSYNVSTEFVVLNQARSLANLAYLATLTASSTQAWTSVAAQIPVPTNTVPLNVPLTLTLQPPAGLDLTAARVVWEARDQEPAYGTNFTFAPVCAGTQWVEVEATWPDGRRVFGTNQFWADSPVVDWVDDLLPKGAVLNADGGDGWNWIAHNPTPYSGALAHQSTLGSGLHEHYFSAATASMAVSTGNILFAYVYLDPTNVPSELMLQWNDGASWEHRAYWGANDITYGTSGTVSRYYAGPLPPAGQWAPLAVPASAVGLEGRVVSGLAFSLYNGRATWDYAGKAASTSTAIADTSPPVVTITAPGAGAAISGIAVMTSASATDDIAVAGVQFQLDGANLGSALTNAPYALAWNTVTVPNGTHTLTGVATDMAGNATTASPVSVVVSNVTTTPLSTDTTPPTVTLTAPLAGATVSGSAVSVSATATDDVSVARVQFQLDGANLGAALTAAPYVITWDSTTATSGAHSLTAIATDPAGNSATATPVSVTVSNVTTGTTGTTTNVVDWVDDALPAGAIAAADGGDSWYWINTNPTPYSGALAHQSAVAAGLHEHYFSGATATLPVNTGDTVFTYVYLDPANVPSEVMLSWNDGSSWEHRAYWGADAITYGADGTAGRYYMGPLPPAGQWTQLAVPASAVALQGLTVSGMGFTLYNGRATWDYAGKFSITTSTSTADTTPPTVVITAPLAGTIVSGTAVTVSANATDDVSVASVQFQLDGVNLGAAVAAAPYAVAWNSTSAANGMHRLTAVATDGAGNQATASPVSVTVSNPAPVLTVAATANAARVGLVPGAFAISVGANTNSALTVNYTLSGTASNGMDYVTSPTPLTIPAGATSVTLTVTPEPASYLVGSESAVLTLSPSGSYALGASNSATVTITGNRVPILSVKSTRKGNVVTWSSVVGKIYRVAYWNTSTSAWTNLSGLITATGTTTAYTDTTSKSSTRTYAVYVTN